MRIDFNSRRQFLRQAVTGLSVLGTGLISRQFAFAGPTQIAALVEETPESHPLHPALKTAAASLQSLNDVKDYTATFYKKELVGKKQIEARMDLKLREAPFSVYVKFLDPYAGREVLYVEGQHSNQLKVRDVGFAGLAGTVSLDPTGSYAMDENRYPLTNIGMRHLLSTLTGNWMADAHLEGLTVTQKDGISLGSLKCQATEVTHRVRHQTAKYHTTRLLIDQDSGRPVRVQAFAFPGKRENAPPAVEDYYYSNVSINVGLKDMDFSTENPQYRF